MTGVTSSARGPGRGICRGRSRDRRRPSPGTGGVDRGAGEGTYLIGYTTKVIDAAELLERVRVSSGLTQEELARRAGTSRPTLSAYEHGRKSPTIATFARLLSQAGWDLAAEPHVSFTQQTSAH